MADNQGGSAQRKVRSIQSVCNEPEVFHLPSSPGEQPYLIGGKCRSCGMIFFPKASYCQNCGGEGMDEVPLSTRGELYSFTIVRQQPPVYRGPIPYALGIVVLPEGVGVQALLTGCGLEALTIGMKMELVVEKLQEDEEGNDIVCHKFKPLSGG